ncbi:MAG: cobyric acid synthase [Lachnospiraceae bacterium]|nr:cobyric acid synthase [Lachnospiraceae bacterium]
MPEENGMRSEQLHIGYHADLIRDICFSVKSGEIVALIGPNGSGKTTLLKTLTGELKSRGGVIFLNGRNRADFSASEIAKHVSLVMTHKIRPELMTCREVVEIGRYPYTGHLGILSDTDHAKVAEAMRWTDTEAVADDFYDKISDGQKQRVLLARAICQEPEILILDEPTSYLDIRYQVELLKKIVALAKEKKMAVLMSVHELSIARRIADTVVALGEGKVQKIGPPAEVFEESFIRRLYHIENTDLSLLGGNPWEAADNEGTGSLAEAAEVTAEHPVSWADSRAFHPRGKARAIMIQGTMSNVGKSVIAAGLCRIFSDMGYRVAPFKSQNMALNSYVTKEGLEMGRAQVMQAECARTEPLAVMNPILLKPTRDTLSQVIVNGKPVGNRKAKEYYLEKQRYVPEILKAYDALSETFDTIVIEGAGSPVEMNLKENDIVNMGLAEMVDAPVLLVGNIDPGGVFAQLIGTLDLLTEAERTRVQGLIINQFRGDESLFADGIRFLEERTNVRVAGIVPYLDVKLDDEDSLSVRLSNTHTQGTGDALDLAVIRLKHISNFTDFDTFEQVQDVHVRYVSEIRELGDPDLIVLPGTKNTIEDLEAIRENGLADALIAQAKQGKCIIGICGGYQMLGETINDPDGAESGGTCKGLGLLPVETVLASEKSTTNITRRIVHATGVLSGLAGLEVSGYEIHMGKTKPVGAAAEFTSDGSGCCMGNVYGTYLHGFFDGKEILCTVLESIAAANGKTADLTNVSDYAAYKDGQYDLLAAALKEHLDMDLICKIMGLK